MRARGHTQAQAGAPATLYHDYLNVIYGLLATAGLEQLSQLIVGHHLSLFLFLLFAAAFLTGVHFWFVCVTVDDICHPVYSFLAQNRPGVANAFLLIDALFAASFAGCVLTMFRTIDANPIQVCLAFLYFLYLALLSLLYDIYALVLGFVAGARSPGPDELERIRKYSKVNWKWVLQDGGYVVLAWAAYEGYRKYGQQNELPFGSALVILALSILVVDIIVLHPQAYRDAYLR